MSEHVLVTGGTGMVGNAFARINDPLYTFTRVGSSDYDLTNWQSCQQMFKDIKPVHVIHLAAKVGGVKGNTDYVGDFFRINSLINTLDLLIQILNSSYTPEQLRSEDEALTWFMAD